MEFFLVFLLGIMLGVGILYLLRPALFVHSAQDYSVMEQMFEDYMQRIEAKETELEEREKRFIEQIEEKEKTLLHFYSEITTTIKDQKMNSPKVQAVLNLAKSGHNDVAIAKKLSMGVGEVQLILSLTKEAANS